MQAFSDLKRSFPARKELDILSSSSSSYSAVDTSTGEYVTGLNSFKAGELNIDPVDGAFLVDRFALQSVARSALPDYRVSKCLRLPISTSHHISVYKNSALKSVFFGGLQTCGSVWHCPVCAAKISEKRVSEVQHAIDYCKEQGGFVSFITRTVPHSQNDNLKGILERFRQAEKLYKGSRYYRSTLASFGSFGQIKVFEITVGVNGWHLHVHEIMLHHESSIDDFYQCLESNLYSLWSSAAVDAGFELPSRAHGLQVQNGDFAASYIAKFGKEPKNNWSSSRELTKQHIKRSKSGFSPFDLMRYQRDSPQPFILQLITEYGEAMHRARQLIWSRGLKKLVCLVEFTDAEIAAQMDETAALLGLISLDQWRFIIKMDLRSTVLLIAKYHDYSALVAFLVSIGAPDFD
jgi:hypothetical protein